MSNEDDAKSNPTPINSVEEPFVEVISEDEDETLTQDQKALLRYKHKVKKIFREPKFVKLTEQIGKLERSLSEKKSKKAKDHIIKDEQGKYNFSPKFRQTQDAESLSTPSELMYAPSDFEHVFHAQDGKGKHIQDKKELQREQEMLAKIFERIKTNQDPVIPIYTGDDSMKTKVVNIPLARLNELFGQKEAAIKANKQKNTMPTIPVIKPFNNITPNPKLKTIDKSIQQRREVFQRKQLMDKSLSPTKLIAKKESNPNKNLVKKESTPKSVNSKSVGSKSLTIKNVLDRNPKILNTKLNKAMAVKNEAFTLRALLLKEIKRTYN